MTLLMMLLCSIFFGYECNSTKSITLSGEELQNYIAGYPDFLQSVQENTENVGMLATLSDNSTFLKDNIAKTLSDYGQLKNIRLVAGENKGIVIYSNFVFGDGIIVAMVLAVLLMFAQEKSKGLSYLVRCTKDGRSRLSLQRSAIIVITSIVASLLVMSTCILTSLFTCGYTDLSRPLQSIPEFSMCAYPISIAEYLLLTAFIKALATALLGLLVQFLLVWLDSIPALLITVTIALVEFMLYTLILGSDRLAGWKLANMMALLRTEIFFKNYFNINVFGAAVSFLPFSAGIIIVLTLCIMIASASCSAKCHGLNLSMRFIDNAKEWLSKHTPNPPLLFWELKKVFLNQKGIIILLAVIYFAASSCLEYDYYYYVDPHREYLYSKYAGVITQEKLTEMKEEYETHSEELLSKSREVVYLIENNLEPERNLLLQQECFSHRMILIALEQILVEAEGALDYSVRTGTKTQLVKPDAYEMLLVTDQATTNKNSMFILLGLIGIFSGLVACEKESNMTVGLRSLMKGRNRLLCTKLAIIVLTAPVLVLSVFAAQFYQIADAVGFHNLEAAAQSIELLRDVPFSISIGGYLLLVYAIRVFSAMLAGSLIMLISKLSPNRISAICIATALLVVPAILYMAC